MQDKIKMNVLPSKKVVRNIHEKRQKGIKLSKTTMPQSKTKGILTSKTSKMFF